MEPGGPELDDMIVEGVPEPLDGGSVPADVEDAEEHQKHRSDQAEHGSSEREETESDVPGHDRERNSKCESRRDQCEEEPADEREPETGTDHRVELHVTVAIPQVVRPQSAVEEPIETIVLVDGEVVGVILHGEEFPEGAGIRGIVRRPLWVLGVTEVEMRDIPTPGALGFRTFPTQERFGLERLVGHPGVHQTTEHTIAEARRPDAVDEELVVRLTNDLELTMLQATQEGFPRLDVEVSAPLERFHDGHRQAEPAGDEAAEGILTRDALEELVSEDVDVSREVLDVPEMFLEVLIEPPED